MGYRLSQGGVSCRRLVVAEHMLKLTRSCHDFREPRAPQGIYLRNVGRLAASQHQDFVPARSESMAQVVHQFADTAALTQALAKNGKLPRTDFRRNHRAKDCSQVMPPGERAGLDYSFNASSKKSKTTRRRRFVLSSR